MGDRDNEYAKLARERLDATCHCHRCNDERREPYPFMVLCPQCGNKRCPRASDHRLDCTGSNAPGQAGSIYGSWRLNWLAILSSGR